MPNETPPEIVNLTASLAADFPALDSTALGVYLGEIALWNRRIGLVSKKTTAGSLDRLVRQSAQLLELIFKHRLVPAGTRVPQVIDIGTGAGFPGVIWKLLEPELSVVLVERKSKKATFLERIKIVLALEGVDVVAEDAAQLVEKDGLKEQFDVAVSFAVGEPAALAGTVKGLLKRNGCYCTLRPIAEVVDDRMGGEPFRLVETAKSEYGQYCLYQKTGE